MKALKGLNLALALLLSGIVLAIIVVGNPAGLSSSDYIWRQQAMIRALNTPMPLLGLVTILVTLASARLRWTQRRTRWLLITGAGMFVGAGVITRLCNQPINAVVMTWDPNAPPSGWQVARDDWWHWHSLRTVLVVFGSATLAVGYSLEKQRIKALSDVA